MVRRNVFIGLVSVFACFVMAVSIGTPIGSTNLASAQDDPVPSDGTQNNPWRIGTTMEEFNAYNSAIMETGCATPSLECLVRNTTRFVAIEWVQEIMGPNFYVDFKDGGCFPGSLGCPDEPPQQPSDAGGGSKLAAGSQGVIASTFGLIGGMYTYKPAATSRYVAYVLDNADLAPPAYAQGIGFAALDPILDLWRMMRNVAYFFFIGVFIIIGFMIMFRQKISGQAAITAQQAIPSIIISLILVTFSYAISGFLIDIMYLFMFMLLYLFNFALPAGATISADAATWNIFQLGGNLMRSVWDPNSNANLVGEMVRSVFSMDADGNWASNGLAWIGGLTLSVVLAVAVLIGVVRLFFELLKSYASIIMHVIFAPFFLMVGAFPGKNAFMPWLKNMIGNLAAFPTVLLFVMLYHVFTSNVVSGNAGFMPPYLIGGGQAGISGYLLGLAIILALPEIVKDIKKRAGASEGGFGMLVAGAAAARAGEGWRGKYGVPGAKYPIGLATLPFSVNRIGPETAMENLWLGSRAARKREEELRRLSPHSKKNYYGLSGYLESKFTRTERGRDTAATAAAHNAQNAGQAPTTQPGATNVGSGLNQQQTNQMLNP